MSGQGYGRYYQASSFNDFPLRRSYLWAGGNIDNAYNVALQGAYANAKPQYSQS